MEIKLTFDIYMDLFLLIKNQLAVLKLLRTSEDPIVHKELETSIDKLELFFKTNLQFMDDEILNLLYSCIESVKRKRAMKINLKIHQNFMDVLDAKISELP